MKIKVCYVKFLALLLFLVSCSSAKNDSSRIQEQNALKALVNSRSIQVKSDWALPLNTYAMNQISNAGLYPPGSNAGRINLIGNPNYLKIEGDSVSARLPYFGERQMGNLYGGQNTGIYFKGKPKDFEIIKNEKKKTYSIRFRVSEASENYQVSLTLSPNLKSVININSNQRFTIAYQGMAAPLGQE